MTSSSKNGPNSSFSESGTIASSQRSWEDRVSQLSWDDRVYGWPPTWWFVSCQSDRIQIAEPKSLSRGYIIFFAILSLIVLAPGLFVYLFMPAYAHFTMIAVPAIMFVGALVTRWLEVRQTGNEGDIALSVTSENVYFGKSGSTVPRECIFAVECIVDFGPRYYSKEYEGEGKSSVYSEVNLLEKQTEAVKRHPVIGVRGDAGLACANRITSVTGWEVRKSVMGITPKTPCGDAK